jgi:Glucose / Sorbosone dehydrogenase
MKTVMGCISAAMTALMVVSGFAGRSEPFALEVADFAELPVTGLADGTGNNAGSLARINVMREEPAPSHRLFVNDLTGPLYILDRQTRTAAPYLDLNGRGERAGLFEKLTTDIGLASGFISFEFDPDYATNGRFYTIHLEELALPGALAPNPRGVPGLAVKDYTPTTPVQVPGTSNHEGVLIEWTDSNIANTTFEGTARELLRIRLNDRIHPLGDITFNPSARPGDADWRVMYIACGDGGSGDQFRSSVRLNPQRLDTLVGKILRIVPDLAAHTTTSGVSDNGRYRIPNDNPFASVAGARPEVWAYGLRNPHRLSWDVDPKVPSRPRLIATVIGWRTWETVVFIQKGGNYGYPLREGIQRIDDGKLFDDLPRPDQVPRIIDGSQTTGSVTPTYPVLQYGHSTDGGGDAIAGGIAYRGKVSRLAGNFVFGDISTGRLWYSDIRDMVAADDGVAQTLAPIHQLSVWWDDPHDSPDRGTQRYPTMAPIVQAAYHARGGKDPDLPGTGSISGSGRVDLRFATDRTGALYLLSKSDGTIRVVTGARD